MFLPFIEATSSPPIFKAFATAAPTCFAIAFVWSTVKSPTSSFISSPSTPLIVFTSSASFNASMSSSPKETAVVSPCLGVTKYVLALPSNRVNLLWRDSFTRASVLI